MALILWGLGILVGVVLLYLVVVTFGPGFEVPRLSLHGAEQPGSGAGPDAGTRAGRSDVSFEVRGCRISAWLYLPQSDAAPVPCIVMVHGLGGTKDILLQSYAIRFQEAGYAVLTFDHRHMGDSEGEPRQLIWMPRQLEDVVAAIAFARGLERIDPERIALWGTSAGGGHVVVAAARDQTVACVVAQVPGTDGRAAGEMFLRRVGAAFAFRMLVHGQRDMMRYRLGLAPHRIPLVGQPGSVALMADSGAVDFFRRVAPASFVNEACARVVLRASMYRPVEHAKDVRCPVLLQLAESDSLVPVSAVEETANRLGQLAEVRRYPIGHFDIYHGDNFERAVSDQLVFFRKHLSRD
ncbi:MAG: alpha/beta fold hydrolase [Gemmatimonadota bacterium]|nr:MAG: alpha/beta fold hydrolase [Gemmatimonadota bacterium]